MPNLIKKMVCGWFSPESPEAPKEPEKPLPASILWLQSKQIPAQLYVSFVTEEVRKAHWKCMAEPEGCVEKEKNYYHDARARLDVIYESGDTASNTRPSEAHVFTKEEFSGYDASGSILYYVHEDACIQRYQKSRLCYMHAVAMVQYYSIVRYRKKKDLPLDHTVLDIASFIREKFEPDELERHIFHNSGGRSEKELLRILQPGSVVKSVHITDISGVIHNLKEYGPALVANFKVFPDFENNSIHKHYGSENKGKEDNGGHAMVLVGYKYEEGKHYFLIQNWWLKKQFLEVDHDYFLSCQAKLFFVETEQEGIPIAMPRKCGSWMETASAEFLDGYDLEG